MTGGQHFYAHLVGEGGAGDLLGHGSGFEFFGVEGVDGGGFGADEFGFLDGVFFVGFEADFVGFFVRFLEDEGGHFFELGGYLVGLQEMCG